MRPRIVTLLLAGLLAAAVALLILLLSSIVELATAMALGISILAAIFTAVTAFKNELLPFQLSVFADCIHLVTGKSVSNPNETIVQVLLPISFFNRGYSEGIIETVRLVLKAEQRNIAADFLPAMEIDMVAFVQQGKGVNASNMLGAFIGFVLEPKRAIQKFILFTPKVDGETHPFEWQADTYTFEIYIQTHNKKRPKKYYEVTQEIGNKTLRLLASGKAQNVFFFSDRYGTPA